MELMWRKHVTMLHHMYFSQDTGPLVAVKSDLIPVP
jgi:hypothetical protein